MEAVTALPSAGSVTATTGNFDSPAGHRGNNTPAKAIMEAEWHEETMKSIEKSRAAATVRIIREVMWKTHKQVWW